MFLCVKQKTLKYLLCFAPLHLKTSGLLINGLILQGTHAQMTYMYSLSNEDLKWAEESGTAWYRSKYPASISYPFVGQGYLSNKKWPLLKVNKILVVPVPQI